MTDNGIRIFDSGTQFMGWKFRNCDRCTKGASVCCEPNEVPTCDIEYALAVAFLSSSTVTLTIATRAGWDDGGGRYTWRCSEFDEAPNA